MSSSSRLQLRAVRLLAAALLLLIPASPLCATGLVDPLLHFRQTRTEHFIIYYHDGEQPLARRLAAIAEEIRDRIGEALAVSPPALTHVVLANQSEAANGWATPLPRNIVFLNAAVPSGAEFIGETDDWLRLVFTHELTHVVHLDRSGGWARVVRRLFGRTPVAFPNFWLPQWQIEGLATYEESAIAGRGRAAAGDFRAIERVSARAERSLTLDRASGGLLRWPGAEAPYAAGLGFHEYLARHYGEDTLGALAARTARRVPFLGSGAFKGVYGQSLGSLWDDYTADLAAESNGGLTAPQDARRLTTYGYIVTGPRFAPALCEECPLQIVYTARGPHGFPVLRAVGADATGDRELTTRYLGATTGVSARTIVFDQQELRREVGLYSDLHVFDRASGGVRRLTREARLQDPDLAPDGIRIAAVRERDDRRELVITTVLAPDTETSFGDRSPAIRVVSSAANVHFSAPRWSPDGRHIAAERRRLGALSDLVVIDAASGAVEQTIAIAEARIVTPTWRPDGGAVVAAVAGENRPFELYEFPLEGVPEASRLTRSAGAIWPDVSADGNTLVFAAYTADGYDLFAAHYEAMATGRLPFLRNSDDGAAPGAAALAPLNARDYSPLTTLAPTSWTPLVAVTSDQTRAGAGVAGADLLGRHAYAVNATWLVTGRTALRPPSDKSPDWSAAYVYERWRPSLFVSAARDTLFRDTVSQTSTRGQSTVALVRREVQAGIAIPVTRVRRQTQLFAAMVGSSSRYLFPAGDRDVRLVSSRLAFAHNTARMYGYSISPEDGVALGVTIEASRRAFGSEANATSTTADVRAYLSGIRRHHVLALRAAGGLSRGDELATRRFIAGAVSASPSTIDFGASALGLLRAPAPAASGDRILVGNVEYRLPLKNIERGFGTWPLFVQTAHASLFVDAAQLNGSTTIGWRRAAGGELGVRTVIGYALPIDAVVGAAWSIDGAARGMTVYARLGRAF